MREDKVSNLKKVAEFGEKYHSGFLSSEDDKEKQESNIWEALSFFFRKTFYGGRRNELSTKYRKCAEEVICRMSDRLEASLRKGDSWDKKGLNGELKEGGLDKEADRKMVIETLEFISDKNDFDYNLIQYSKELIREGRVEDLFREIDDIHNIGKKKASLFVRDLVDLYNLDNHIEGEEYVYLHPVDTWVHQVAKYLDLLNSEKPSWKTDSKKIVAECLKAEVSPIKFNQGAWYIGNHSLRLVLKNLKNLHL